MNKERVIHNLIEVLNGLFSDNRLYEITLLAWETYKGKDFSTIELRFNYQLVSGHCLVQGHSESLLFPVVFINPPFYNHDNTHTLAQAITEQISPVYVPAGERNPFNFFSGITLNRHEWKDTIDKVFGEKTIKMYEAEKIHEKLNHDLPVHTKKTKQLKI